MRIWDGFARNATSLKAGTASARSLAVGMGVIVGVRDVAGLSSHVVEGKQRLTSTW